MSCYYHWPSSRDVWQPSCPQVGLPDKIRTLLHGAHLHKKLCFIIQNANVTRHPVCFPKPGSSTPKLRSWGSFYYRWPFLESSSVPGGRLQRRATQGDQWGWANLGAWTTSLQTGRDRSRSWMLIKARPHQVPTERSAGTLRYLGSWQMPWLSFHTGLEQQSSFQPFASSGLSPSSCGHPEFPSFSPPLPSISFSVLMKSFFPQRHFLPSNSSSNPLFLFLHSKHDAKQTKTWGKRVPLSWGARRAGLLHPPRRLRETSVYHQGKGRIAKHLTSLLV